MLYPLSYEGGDDQSAGHTLCAVLDRSGCCPIPARGVPVRGVSNGFLNFCSWSVLSWCRIANPLVTALAGSHANVAPSRACT